MLQWLHISLQIGLDWLAFLFGIQPSRPGWSPALARLIQYGVLLAIVLLLAWYSPRIMGEQTTYNIPVLSWLIRNCYLAVLFVLFYVFLRMFIAAIRLFWSRDISEFKDIDDAFDVGLESLARAGYDIQWLPVFLVTGATHTTARQFFVAAGQNWKADGFSDLQSNLAVTFHATDEALLICLPNVGATVDQLQKSPAAAGGGVVGRTRLPPAMGMNTIRPGELAAAQQVVVTPAAAEAHMGRTLKPGALAAANQSSAAQPASVPSGFDATLRPGQLKGVLGSLATSDVPVAVRQGAPEKLTKEEFDRSRRRLEYFCQRLAEERGTYCTINGLLQVVPWRWTLSPAYEPLFGAIQTDLQTLHDSLHQLFPVVCIHSGLEEVVGLPELLDRGKELDHRFRDSRAGSRFPAGRAIDEQSTTWVVERSLEWFRDWVFAAFAKNLGSPLNRRLYQLLCVLSDRRGQLQRELKLTLGGLKLALTPRLSGIYFAATGADATRQAFVQGVIQRLLSEQNDVTWMPDWHARDRRLLVLTFVVGLLTCAVLVADLYLVVRIWQKFADV